MNNTQEVVRYIRPDPYPFGVDYELYNDNLYGIVLVHKLDYDKKWVTVKWSVCDGDNFDKKEGIRIAKDRPEMFGYELGLVDDFRGLTLASTYVANELTKTIERDLVTKQYDTPIPFKVIAQIYKNAITAYRKEKNKRG